MRAACDEQRIRLGYDSTYGAVTLLNLYCTCVKLCEQK